MSKKTKTVGILGGMGPLATADLFQKIILHTRADCDQEHLHILVDNNTNIPDRTNAILSSGTDPVPEMLSSARRLAVAGADFLIMPCNTAHFFYPQIAAAVEIPVLHMIRETAARLSGAGVKKAGLLSTSGTIRSGIYARELHERGIEVLQPDDEGQREVMHVIYDVIKAGRTAYDSSFFRKTCMDLLAGGAECLILGCTELPPAFAAFGIELPHVDPTLILAEAAIRFAGAEYVP